MAGERRAMTTKQAKAAFKKRGGMSAPPSTQDKRRLDRQVELADRADSIRQKAERAKQNAFQRKKKEERQREARIAQGLPPEPESKIAASQPRIKSFFVNNVAKIKQHDKREDEAHEAAQGEKRELKELELEAQELEKLQRAADESDEYADEEYEKMGDDESETVDVAQDFEQLPVQQAPQRVVKRAGTKKRNFDELSTPAASLPTRRPGDVTDPLVQTNVKEIWVPPSQDTIKAKRSRAANDSRSGSNYSRLDRDIEDWKVELRAKQTLELERQSRYPARRDHLTRKRGREAKPNQSPRTSPSPTPQTRGTRSLSPPSAQALAPAWERTTRHVSAPPASDGEQHQTTVLYSLDDLEDFPNDSQIDLDPSAGSSSRETKTSTEKSKARLPVVPASPILSLRQTHRSQVSQAAHQDRQVRQDVNDEKVADRLQSESQLFLESNGVNPAQDAEAEGLSISFPSDSQALDDPTTPKARGAAETQTPPHALAPPAAVQTVLSQQVKELIAGITSSQFAEFDDDLVENPLAADEMQTPRPTLHQTAPQEVNLAPEAADEFELIPSSQLAELEVDLIKKVPDVSTTKPAQMTCADDDFDLSQALDLDPEEASALETAAAAAAQRQPHQQSDQGLKSGTEMHRASNDDGLSDYGELDISSQELRELAA